MNNMSVSQETSWRRTLLRARMGLQRIAQNKHSALIILGVFAIYCFLWLFHVPIFGMDRASMMFGMMNFFINISFLTVGLVSLSAGLLAAGTPKGAFSLERDLLRAGIVNHSGEPPLLVSIENKDGVKIIELDTYGIPLSLFLERQAEIENALDLFVAKIEDGTTNRRIILHTVPSSQKLKNRLLWQDQYLPQDEPGSFQLALGESVLGKYCVDFAITPHLLLGGSTGSGKSVLLRSLCWQAREKGATVIICDLKGGVDYPRSWKNSFHFATTENNVLALLERLEKQLNVRKEYLEAADCANIDDYNAKCDKKLRRLFFVCDEVAELLDPSGLSKEKRRDIDRFVGLLATLARQGRAFGIHLILATQRPDANVIPGQIKSNIDIRVCGRADKILSKIILDNEDAADKIKKTAQGRFLANDGTLLQGYWFDPTAMPLADK